MSDTPKTDAAATYAEICDDEFDTVRQWVVDREFARAQERRIAELESLNATLETSNRRLRAKLDRRNA